MGSEDISIHSRKKINECIRIKISSVYLFLIIFQFFLNWFEDENYFSVYVSKYYKIIYCYSTVITCSHKTETTVPNRRSEVDLPSLSKHCGGCMRNYFMN